MQSFAEIFRRRRGRLDLDRLAALHRVRRMWTGMVGEKLAQHTFVHSLQREVLYVLADSSVWVSELEFLRLQIIERAEMVAECGITRMQCRVAKLPASQDERLAAPAVAATNVDVPLSEALQQEVARLPEALQTPLRRLLHRRR